jgi:carboxyl-terminal processing protease
MIKEDSTIAEFKTHNGRPVFDGRGILPDVNVVLPEMPKVIGGLLNADLIFDFATRYHDTHPTIPPADQFVLTEEIWQEFVAYARDKHFTYDTESMDALNALIETSKRERYYDHVQPQIDALKSALTPDRVEELSLFRKDIEEVLKDEIVGRYYFQTGRAQAALSTDPYLLKAIEVLNDTPTYAGILNGTIKP